MRGSNTFSQADAEQIKRYLDLIVQQGRYDSTTASSILRVKYNFYKKDFMVPKESRTLFNSTHFDEAVKNGQIIIK